MQHIFFDPQPWMEDARCYTDKEYFGMSYTEWQRQWPHENFFGDKGPFVDEAKEFCKGCPVRDNCLSYAISDRIDDDIWGGLTSRERRAIQRKARKAVLVALEQMTKQSQDDSLPSAS